MNKMNKIAEAVMVLVHLVALWIKANWNWLRFDMSWRFKFKTYHKLSSLFLNLAKKEQHYQDKFIANVDSYKVELDELVGRLTELAQ